MVVVTFVSATRARHRLRAARNRISHLCKSTPSADKQRVRAPRAHTHTHTKSARFRHTRARKTHHQKTPSRACFFSGCFVDGGSTKKSAPTKETSRAPPRVYPAFVGNSKARVFARAPCYGAGGSARVGGNNHRRFSEDGAARLPRIYRQTRFLT